MPTPPAFEPTSQDPRTCTNCGHVLAQPVLAFCPVCGQETRIRAPRLGEFVQQFGGAYLSTEGALWRTLKLLLTKPGELTRQYLAGRRKHYVLPLRLYLTISLVVLVALRVVAGLAIDRGVVMAPLGEPAQKISINVLSFSKNHRAGYDDGVYVCIGLPSWVCQRLQRHVLRDAADLRAFIGGFGQRSLSHAGLAMFVLLPAFALWLKLLYWNRRLHYTEHLVMALHLHAFWFLMVALMLPKLPVLSEAAPLAMLVYTALAMHRVYGGGWVWLLVRLGLLTLLQLAALMLATMGVVIVALLA
jgi:predicted RNA-binding Zn-ribbon protein involved in translation (DUF1610 family)